MKKKLLSLTLAILCFSPVFCQTLYTSTALAGYRTNPGLGQSGTPKVILDDIQIPSAMVQGTDSVNITMVKFGILRGASAPAVTINFYYSPLNEDAVDYDGLVTVPPILIGSADFPANGTTAVGSLVVLGDSVNSLFKVKTDTGFLYDGYQALLLGMSFSAPGTNGWGLTTPGAPNSENDDVFWIYNADSTVKSFATYFGGPPNPSATFYAEVFGGPSTLPLTLTEFSAKRLGALNLLKWTTQQELNTSHFVIERSSDGRSFASIGQVAAAGNSSTVRTYTYTDAHPGKGFNYYRLRTIDKDNKIKLSAIRSIRNLGLANIMLYPNPVTNKLTVSVDADKATDGYLTISDVSGKTLYSRSIKLPGGNSIIPVALSNIPAGSYIMKIQLDDDIIVKQFNKQ